MEIIDMVVLGFMVGSILGVALEKSRVFEPIIIQRQLQFSNHLFVKVFLTAIAVGSIAFYVMRELDMIGLYITSTFPVVNVFGGAIFGIGFAIAGAGPLTVFAQIGAGYKDAWAVLAGGIAGAFLYSLSYPTIQDRFLYEGFDKIQLFDIIPLSYAITVTITVAIIGIILFYLERKRSWQQEAGINGQGD
ncbi:MAG: YeeE/YedE thiosulfate transporter family protein [Alphaproteobacteria bacterium]